MHFSEIDFCWVLITRAWVWLCSSDIASSSGIAAEIVFNLGCVMLRDLHNTSLSEEIQNLGSLLHLEKS